MKKTKKVSLILFPLLAVLLLVIAYICYSNIYTSNEKIKDFYYTNIDAFNQYISRFDEDAYLKDKQEIKEYFSGEAIIEDDFSDKLYKISDSLSKAKIDKIEYYNGCLFFDFPSEGEYYNSIYYSFGGVPSEDCPIYSNDSDNEKYKFRNVGKDLYINGRKNRGIDWYKTEKIEGNWYYCEVHLS